MNALLAQKPEESPFALPLKKFPASISAADQARYHDAIVAAITKQVYPAYQHFAKFLQGVYIPAGRTEPGVWSLPDGDAYYAFRVKQSTTTDLTPAQIHQIGVDQVAQDEADMLVIAKKLGYADVAAMRAAINANPKLHPTSREQLLDAFRVDIDTMRPKLPELFGRLPKRRSKSKLCPAFMEKDQAPAYYEQGTPDGSHGPAPSSSTPTTSSIAHSLTWSPSRTTKACLAIICRFPSLRNSPACRRSANTDTTPPSLKAGGCTPSDSARTSASIRIRIRTSDAWRPISSARSVSSSILACTRSTGRASRWWTISTRTPGSTMRRSTPSATATSPGPRRRWGTRLAS